MHRAAPARTDGKRLDVQGLRMVAVVAVVVNHLTGHPKGGFTGVDVFFVISGFLITSHLVRDLGRTRSLGHYLSDFYRRRVRRLFPAALIVIVLTVLLAHTLFSASRYQTTWHDGVWAAVFWANWHFAAIGTDYFSSGSPDSPLQHYWSLSVEEQFYVVWPVALFLVGWVLLGRRRHNDRARQFVGAAAAAVLCIVSLWFAFGQSTATPVTAYFSTYTRGWELGLGALLAGVLPYLRARTGTLTIMSWTGLTMIGISLFTVHGGSGFPVPGALLPCLGAALVLGAATSRARARNVILTNRVSVYIGDISYSIYLVHFPVIIFLESRMRHGGWYFYAAASLLSLGLAILLYSVVERPILDSTWLLPRQRPSRPSPRRPRLARHMLATGLVITIAGAGAYVWWPGENAALAHKYEQVNQGSGPTASSTSPGSPTSSTSSRSSTPAVAAKPAARALAAQITAALKATSYPELHPSMDSVIAGPQARGPFVRCALIKLQPMSSCVWGDVRARHTMYLAGDSTSMVYAEALAHIAEHTRGWKFRFVGAYGCRFSAVVYRNPQLSVQNGCRKHIDDATAEIKRVRPDVLVISNAFHPYQTLTSDTPVTPEQQTANLNRQLSKVRSSVRRIVIMSPPPDGGGDIAACYQPGQSPVECVTRPGGLWKRMDAVTKKLAPRMKATFVESKYWFCSEREFCPTFVTDVPVMHDKTHAAPAYMDLIWPVIKEAFVAAKVFTV